MPTACGYVRPQWLISSLKESLLLNCQISASCSTYLQRSDPPTRFTCLYSIIVLIFQGHKLENVLGPQRQHFVQKVAKDFHKEMPWFHEKISRSDSEKVMKDSRHENGKFLYVLHSFNDSCNFILFELIV